MAIACPLCNQRINLKASKPGRFRPRCPQCRQLFLLIVPEAGGAVVVEKVLNEQATNASAGVVAAMAAAVGRETQAREPAVRAIAGVPGPPSEAFALGSQDLRAAPVDVATRTPMPEEYLGANAQVRGYELERELGRGGMGKVYLARQLSLARHVALKVMSKRWASDPVFVARFTREAYAAAQLSHPNIVQIHDIGEAEGTRFFSMEYVRGCSLADLVRTQGKLDPETAVGYILQAARGLKHAHDRGMIHRDVKPDNLLLDNQGLVKVADLGLVKTGAAEPIGPAYSPSSAFGPPSNSPHLTGARIALGTPAYMSPEQCRDAASVDHRADIYSLGCTLYVLVTGRPPFDGGTAIELMTKHAYEPIVPPEQIVSRVPKELSAVIQRMMEKNPADRFQSMAEVVRMLESWLGVRQAVNFSPQEEQIAQLESHLRDFTTAPAAVFRSRLLTGFFVAIALVSVLVTFFGRPGWVFGLVGLAVQAGLAYFLINGVAGGGHLFTRSRQFLSGLSWGDWAVAASGLALFGLVLAMLGVFWMWAGFGFIGLGLALALRYGVDRAVEVERSVPLEATERLLRRLRLQGLAEDDVRLFVAKFAGREWEEFFEALFGYEAKLVNRALLQRGGSAGARDKYAAWREPLIALMDRVEKARRLAREQKLLQAVEQANLLATGATPEAAEKEARAAANAMVNAAVAVRAVEQQRVRIGHPTQLAAPVNVRQTVMAAQPCPFAFEAPRREPMAAVIGLLVGPHVRAVAAAVLLAGSVLWAYQNGMLPSAGAREEAVRAVEAGNLAELKASVVAGVTARTQPLEIAGLPSTATNWADGWNAGLAGLLLFGSLLYRGNVMAAFVLLGAGVAAVGHQHGIRTVEPFRAESVALLLGGVLALVGFRTAR